MNDTLAELSKSKSELFSMLYLLYKHWKAFYQVVVANKLKLILQECYYYNAPG